MTKRARKQNNFVKQKDKKRSFDNSVVELKNYQNRTKKITILPRNVHQEDYIDLLTDSHKSIVFATGPAGTGKTMLAVQMGIKMFDEGIVKKIVITRPAVSVDEQHGFLPGTLEQKMAPWTRPVFDLLEEHYGVKRVEQMIEHKELEIAPLAYMRGRTFKECWMIADEMQNATPEQMKMFLTRIGTGSKIVVTGDLAQHDRGFDGNGLKDFTIRISNKNSRSIGCVHFDRKDVERHHAVIEVLNLYDDE